MSRKRKIRLDRLTNMNILITGASGFIGSHITDALIKQGHHVTLCLRRPEQGRRRWPDTGIIVADFSKAHRIDDWIAHLDNIDVVINAVGIIRESGSQSFEALHTMAPIALFTACENKGVSKVIQISALGADESAFSQYHLSKRAADECLMGLNLDWSILMPSIVYGSGAKSMVFFRAIASLPLIPLVDKGDQPVQPIHINDLVQAVLQTIQSDRMSQPRIELVGPEAITIRAIYSYLRQWLGLGKARFISLSYPLVLIVGRLGGFLGNTPLTTEAIQMLRKGNTADVTPFVKRFGFVPVSFEQSLFEDPAQQSDRWHAALYFLKPLLRLSIAFLWIFTGFVSAFAFPVEQSYAMLEKAGLTGVWGPVVLYGAAATDLVLGLATLMAWHIRRVGLVQLAVIILYSIIITFTQPDQWLHPFGPVSKNIPLIVATLIMIVLEKK